MFIGGGEDAPIFAAMRADKCLAAGDLDGKAVWMGVMGDFKELTNTDTPEGEGKDLGHVVEFRSAIQIPGHSLRALAVARRLAKFQPPKLEDPRPPGVGSKAAAPVKQAGGRLNRR